MVYALCSKQIRCSLRAREDKHQDRCLLHRLKILEGAHSPSFLAFTFSTLLAFLSSALNCRSADKRRFKQQLNDPRLPCHNTNSTPRHEFTLTPDRSVPTMRQRLTANRMPLGSMMSFGAGPVEGPVEAHPGLIERQRCEAADGHVVARLLHQGRDIGGQRLDLRTAVRWAVSQGCPHHVWHECLGILSRHRGTGLLMALAHHCRAPSTRVNKMRLRLRQLGRYRPFLPRAACRGDKAVLSTRLKVPMPQTAKTHTPLSTTPRARESLPSRAEAHHAAERCRKPVACQSQLGFRRILPFPAVRQLQSQE